MKTIVTIVFYLSSSSSWPIYAQDTIHFTGTPEEFWVETYDSIFNWKSKSTDYCWRKDQYYNNTLFSTEYLTLNKSHNLGSYTGYFKNGNIAFKRTYLSDDQYCEVHGSKLLYYSNSQLKVHGLYFHSVKIGNWYYFDSIGNILRSIQYVVPDFDTITNVKYLTYSKENIELDTLTVDSDATFLATIPIISFGRNGIEIIYEKNKPIEVRLFEFGSLIRSERKKRKMKLLIKKVVIQPDIILR